MKKLKINSENKKYYSDTYIKGWENGVDAQYKSDIESTPKGEWVLYKGAKTLLVWECNICRCGVTLKGNTPYCPHCGARMTNGDIK